MLGGGTMRILPGRCASLRFISRHATNSTHMRTAQPVNSVKAVFAFTQKSSPPVAFLVALWLSLIAGPALGEALLLKGATVHTVSGETLSPGEVLIRDGKIVSVGPTVEAGGASIVDLSGQHLYPGL